MSKIKAFQNENCLKNMFLKKLQTRKNKVSIPSTTDMLTSRLHTKLIALVQDTQDDWKDLNYYHDVRATTHHRTA
jgi:hypothetical protein